MPMEISSTGTGDLNALVMFVVDATKPFSIAGHAAVGVRRRSHYSAAKLQRRFARHDDADFRSRAGSSFQNLIRPPRRWSRCCGRCASEAGAALVAPGREKRVEHLAPDLRAHAASRRLKN